MRLPRGSLAFTVVLGCFSPSPGNERLAAGLGICEQCKISHEVLWTSGAEDPNVNSGAFFLENQGDLWTMGDFSNETVTRFDLANGTSRAHTRRGDGPGEFSDQIMGAAVHPSGDTLVVAQEARIDYFVRDLEPIRGFRPPVNVYGTLVLHSDGNMTVSNPRPLGLKAYDEFGIHRFTAEGQHLLSFRSNAENPTSRYMPLVAGSDGASVWIAISDSAGFSLERWDVTAGTLLRELRVDVPFWYDPSVSLARLELEAAASGRLDPDFLRPRSGVISVYDAGELVWVVLRHADPRYVDYDWQYYQPHLLYDCIIAAIDTRSGAVLAATAYDQAPCMFTNRGNVVLYDVDDNEFPRFKMLALGLSGQDE
ncbi:MAG: hypothetical protein WEF86_06800 [Gemmatimonadota bacterium]